jgi:acetyl esterase/lipase
VTGRPGPPRTRRDALAAIAPAYRSPLLLDGDELIGDDRLPAHRAANGRPTIPRPDVEVAGVRVGGTRGLTARVHRPRERGEEPAAALLWIFGGGLVTGSAARVDDVASGYAADLGITVVVPEYRLAPEHPYPAALEDVTAALAWMRREAAALGIDADRIAVGGESAGGGLAAALAQRARDEGIPLRLQVLVAPMLDDRGVLRAEADGTVALVWSARENRYAWTAYLGHPPGEDESRPYAVPARAADLAGLAPAWISVGAADLFHDEVVAYADRLTGAGVPCELTVVPGAHHAWETMFPGDATVREVQARRREALAAALRRSR